MDRSAAPSGDAPEQTTIAGSLSKVWWLPLLRGLALVVMGLLLMVDPLGTLETLVWVFAVFLLIDGVVTVVQGLSSRTELGWSWWLVQGVVDVVFAVILLVWPGLTALVLFYVLVVWAIVLGIVAIIGAVSLIRNRDLAWPWLLTFGVLSTLFGLLLVTRPQDADDVLATTVIVFGIYAFVSGAVHVVSAFSVRAVAMEIDRALAGRSPVLDAIVDRRTNARRSAQERSAGRRAEKDRAKAEKAAAKDASKNQG